MRELLASAAVTAPKLPLLLLVLTATPALAESDWFASLYTGDGVELRADERVFTLYALFNAMGYDNAPVTRKDPLPKYHFHPVRKEIRSRMLAADPAMRQQADLFFDAHPVSMERYLQYTVNTAPPPFTTGPKQKELQDLKGLEGLLRAVHTQWNITDAMAAVQGEYRKALKPYLTSLDAPLGRLKKTLKIADTGPQALLVINLLEAQDTVRGVMGDNEVVLVVGPSDKPNVDAILREYARVFVEPTVAKKAQSGWGGGPVMLKEAQLLGATDSTVGEYATSLFSRALALRAMEATEAQMDAEASRGYFGIKDVAKGFDEGKPLDAWMMDALLKVETRRPAPKK